MGWDTLTDAVLGHWAIERPADNELIQHQLFRDGVALTHDWMRGKLSSEDICAWLEHEFGWSAPELMDHLQQSCTASAFTDPAIPSLIANLQAKGHQVVMATDNMDTFTRWTVPSLQLDQQVDGILNSAELGYLKKDEVTAERWPFFDEFLRQNSLHFSDCVLIDDSPKTQVIAKLFGLDYRLVTAGKSATNHLHDLLV